MLETCWGFPQVAGLLMGRIIIRFVLPSISDYYNRKGYCSILMPAVVDHKGLFQDAYIDWLRKVHNVRVFVTSSANN